MPRIKVYHHGITMGTPPARNDHQRAPRGTTQGWTDRAVRSNTAFLRSVRLSDLTGVGLSFTLTVRDCPETADDWHKARRAFVERLRRMGMVRLHWVTEWQRRGVPHLHGVVYFPGTTDRIFELRHGIMSAWCAVAGRFGASPWAQDSKGINDALGWIQYLAKHADRGKNHYQRSAANIPEGWQKTGRMWGRLGDWPVDEASPFDSEKAGAFRLRRMLRSWRIANARADGSPRRIRSARRMLQANTREAAEVRGVSDWIPRSVTMRMLAHLMFQGYAVHRFIPPETEETDQ